MWPYDENERRYFDTALICENGHLINTSMKAEPFQNIDYCKECGAKTISKCKYCNTDIQGDEHGSDFVFIGYTVPKFCYKCGKPYPWTEAEIESAQELVELAKLSEKDKEDFKDAIGNIVVDTPKTKAASAKIKYYLGLIGEGLRNDIKDVLATIGTEVALEAMGLRRK